MSIRNALRNVACCGFLLTITPPACVTAKMGNNHSDPVMRGVNPSDMEGLSLTEISRNPKLYTLFKQGHVKRLSFVSNVPFKMKIDNASIFVMRPASGGRVYILVDSVVTEKIFLDGVMGRVPSNALVTEIVALNP